jgi:hypothetical protein
VRQAAPPTGVQSGAPAVPPSGWCPSSGPANRYGQCGPIADGKTPPSALRRPHRAERVKLRKTHGTAPGMPTEPVVCTGAAARQAS